jgi:hypothetical protein
MGPVTKGLENLPNGVEGPLHRGPCHHASDRQYRSHALHRAPSTNVISALACRTGSSINMQTIRSLSQVSGPSDPRPRRGSVLSRNLFIKFPGINKSVWTSFWH